MANLANLAIDQPGHGPHPGGVQLPMLAVALRQALIVPQPADAVLHPDAPRAKARL